MQNKWQSLIETCTNTAIGYTVAIASQLAIFPLFDISVPLSDNLLIGGYFTIISIARGYIIRRVFNKKGTKK